jgi:hypothetical protein
MTTVIATLALINTLSSGPGASNRSFAAGQENPSAAQTADPSHADAIRQRVKEGQKVRVTDDQGREWQGRIDRFAPDNLELLTNDRQRRDLPYSSILRIDRPRDTLANGAGIGFVSGAAFGLFVVVAVTIDDRGWCCGVSAAEYVLLPAAYGGAGAGIGIAIDALVRRNPTLFRRGDSRVMLAPSLGPGVRGLSLSMRW